jgi:hypothetical protein
MKKKSKFQERSRRKAFLAKRIKSELHAVGGNLKLFATALSGSTEG